MELRSGRAFAAILSAGLLLAWGLSLLPAERLSEVGLWWATGIRILAALVLLSVLGRWLTRRRRDVG